MPGFVIFDLDNTLVDRDAAFRAWAETFIAGQGWNREVAMPIFERADAYGSESRWDFFYDIRDRFGLTQSIDRLVHDYRRDTLQHFRLVDGVPAALTKLREAGYRTGIATNGVRAQEDKIYHVGLDRLVDAWAVSDLVGSSKPERYIFEVLARRCGASLKGAWVVGDRPEADIAGAAVIGARSVLVRHGTLWSSRSYYKPTHAVDNVPEAVDLILADDAVLGRRD